MDRHPDRELIIDEVGRPEPALDAGEDRTLSTFLDFQRATLEWKTRGLTQDQLRASLTPTSMTLAGLLKHLAWVEDYWFTEVVSGEALPEPWASADFTANPDWEWTSAAHDAADDLRALWAERVQAARTVLAGQLVSGGDNALGVTYPAWGGKSQISLRWVLVHMIEEYARHNGHADLLRESIDGQRGE